MRNSGNKTIAGEKKPTLIMAPISIWGIKRREDGPKNLRPRCPFCKAVCYASRIDKNRKRPSKKKKVGRPKKMKDHIRYKKIGFWCDDCEVFFYMDGTPNYKLHVRESVDPE